MATQVFFTNRAQKVMLTTGLLNEIVNGYYSITDINKLYSVTGNTIPTVEITGTKTILTNAKCSPSTVSGGGIPGIPRTTSVTIADRSRALVNFRTSDCDNALYTLSGDTNVLDITINIGTYINNIINLLAAPYSPTTHCVTILIWSFLEATIQEWNLVTEVWEYKASMTAFNIAWQFNSNEDLINWKNLNYFNYVKRGAFEKVLPQDGVFPSSLVLSPSNYTEGATTVQGSGLSFTSAPSYYAYRLTDKDNTTTYTKTLKEGDKLVSQNGVDHYKAITPFAYVAGISERFYLQDDTKYPSEFDKTFGEFHSWKNDKGKQLGTGIVEALVLFFKTNGKYDKITNSYSLQTNFKINTTASSSYNIMEKIGGEVRIRWAYNPANTDSDITTDLINFN